LDEERILLVITPVKFIGVLHRQAIVKRGGSSTFSMLEEEGEQ
jgi:hypothetical protein